MFPSPVAVESESIRYQGKILKQVGVLDPPRNYTWKEVVSQTTSTKVMVPTTARSRLWVVGAKHVGGEWQCSEDAQLGSCLRSTQGPPQEPRPQQIIEPEGFRFLAGLHGHGCLYLLTMPMALQFNVLLVSVDTPPRAHLQPKSS